MHTHTRPRFSLVARARHVAPLPSPRAQSSQRLKGVAGPAAGRRAQVFRFVPSARRGDDVFEFDLIGIDASLANALRRILIAEVRTGRACGQRKRRPALTLRSVRSVQCAPAPP